MFWESRKSNKQNLLQKRNIKITFSFIFFLNLLVNNDFSKFYKNFLNILSPSTKYSFPIKVYKDDIGYTLADSQSFFNIFQDNSDLHKYFLMLLDIL